MGVLRHLGNVQYGGISLVEQIWNGLQFTENKNKSSPHDNDVYKLNHILVVFDIKWNEMGLKRCKLFLTAVTLIELSIKIKLIEYTHGY